MAKKSRKARLAQRQAEAAKASNRRTSAAKPTPTSQPVSNVSAPVAQKSSNFVQDYFYVYSDIRFLVAVTIFMIILMLVLSFVL